MKSIKYKVIDDLVIVVSNDEIFQKKFNDEDDIKKIELLISEINSGLLGISKKVKKSEKLLKMMTNYRSDKKKGEERNSYELAEGDVNENERKSLMKRVAAVHDAFEYDTDGYVFLKGHSVPIPFDLANALLDAKYNENSNFTVESLVNFWYWCCLNPNQDARNDLFGWFKTGDFTITPAGLILAYRCVAIKKKGIDDEFSKFISESFVRVKSWKKSPKNYAVIFEDNDYKLINLKIDSNSHYVDKSCFKGTLSDLYADINSDEAGDVYTDNHTKTMTIKIGEEVTMDRNDCDEQRENSCSRGLHFMSKKYNLRLGGQKLIVLINPMNIVAFPSYDNTKGRCCAYMPVAKALEDENGDFLELGEGTIDFEYATYTEESLQEMIKTHGLKHLQDEGYICKSLTQDDFDYFKKDFTHVIDNKVIHG